MLVPEKHFKDNLLINKQLFFQNESGSQENCLFSTNTLFVFKHMA